MAFQLTNIARDIVEDAAVDRIYVPTDWLAAEGLPNCKRLADPPNRVAWPRWRLGSSRWPSLTTTPPWPDSRRRRSRLAWSVATARSVYREIGGKVLARGPRAWDSRAGTYKLEKTLWLGVAAAQAVASRAPRAAARDARLFRRAM